jgi:HEAT repeat protein
MNLFADPMPQRLDLVFAHFVRQGCVLASLNRSRPGLSYAVLLSAFAVLTVSGAEARSQGTTAVALQTGIAQVADKATTETPADESTSDDEIPVTEDSSIDDLIKALRSDDIRVRAAAIVQSGQRKAKAAPAAELIVEQLQYIQEKVTVGEGTSTLGDYAQRALQGIGPTALPAIRKGLNHENRSVQARCTNLIYRFAGPAFPDVMIDDASTISRLIEILDNEDGLGGAARSALKSIGQTDPTAEKPASCVTDPLLKILIDGLDIPAPEKEWKNNERPDLNDELTKPRQRRNNAALVLSDLADPRSIRC